MKIMTVVFIFIAFFSILAIITLYISILKKKYKDKDPHRDLAYSRQVKLLSHAERSFFSVLEKAAVDYKVLSKVRIADILNPKSGMTKREWKIAFNKISSKHFDFVLCDKNSLDVVAIIELDDKSHLQKKSMMRDSFVEHACETAELKLIRFDVEKSYQIALVRAVIDSKLNIKKSNTVNEDLGLDTIAEL